MKSIEMKAGAFLLSALCASLTIFGSTPTMAEGAGGSGGGMTIIKDGEQKLLAEAGLLFEKVLVKTPSPDYPVYYYIPKETQDEVRRILALIESRVGKLNIEEKVLAKRGTFIEQNDAPSADFEQIKNDYIAVLKNFSQYVDEALLQLPAYSKDNKTYILPLFTTKEPGKELGPTRQALILIHEKYMRDTTSLNLKERLAATLELDAQIYKLVSSKYPAFVDPTGLIEALKPFNDQSLNLDGRAHQIKFVQLQRKVGRPLLLGEFVTNLPTNSGPIAADPSVIQKFKEKDQFAAKQFEPLRFLFSTFEFTTRPEGKLNSQCQKYQQILVSEDALPGDFLIYADPNDITGVMAIYQCKNGQAINVRSMGAIYYGPKCNPKADAKTAEEYLKGYFRGIDNLYDLEAGARIQSGSAVTTAARYHYRAVSESFEHMATMLKFERTECLRKME